MTFNCIGNIPSGNELGGLGQMMLALFSTTFILVVTYFIDRFFGHTIVFGNNNIRIPIYIFCLILVQFRAYKICIYKVKIPTLEEQWKTSLKNEVKDHKFVKKLIRKTELNLPVSKVVKSDSAMIISSLSSFLLEELDADEYSNNQKDLLRRFFSFYKFPEKDEFVRINLKQISKTLNLELLQYSPDQKFFLAYISFNELLTNRKEINEISDCLVFVGTNSKDSIQMYPFFQYPLSGTNSPNRSIAFYKVYKYLSNGFDENYRIYPVTKRIFWENKYLFLKQSVEKGSFYGFQFKNRGKFTAPENDSKNLSKEILKPLIVIEKRS